MEPPMSVQSVFHRKMASTLKKGVRSWLLDEESEEKKENEEGGELLVFGYSCKLFRDDEKADYIDQGKHLIPWMGQENHMIDRYDGRGYIHDLQQYEPVPERDDWQEMSEEERHVESVCDEERYAALKTDPVERDLYHEEEIKRLRAALADDGVYNQVGFSYDDSGSMTSQQDQSNKPKLIDTGGGSSNDEADEEFVPPKELNVPPTMEIPSTNKVNAIVEKTALFVARQGTQMEIVIKAKQASNPQFGFLAFDHPLNPYYKLVVQAVKQGKYIPKPPTVKDNENDDEDDDSDGEGHYLHPSLLSAQKEKELNVPKLNYTRTGDDAYSLLVSRLKDKIQMDVQQQQQTLPPPTEPSKALVLPVAPSSDMTVHTHIPPSNPLPPGLEPVTLPSEQTQDASSSLDESPVLWPPPDLVPIIDKMASYVAKNGQHFESVVKSKSLDSRFEFLTVGHPYYPYYQFKRKAFEKECSRVGTSNVSDDRELKTGVVSFSIKMKDNGEKFKTCTLVGRDGEEAIDLMCLPFVNKVAEVEETEQQKQLKAKLEEVKLAEQRIKDKLAAAARERLAQASREKQLQLERKRKAALFLTMLRKDKEDDDDETIIGPRLPNAMEMTEMIIREDSPPLAALVASAAGSKRIACEERHSPSPGRLRRERRRRSRSNSVSPRRRSRTERHKRRSRSNSREIDGSRHHRRHRRRRSRSRSTKRRSSRDGNSRERKKTVTPPASYSKKRRSPRRSRSRSRRRSSSSSRTKQSKNGGKKRSSSRSSSSSSDHDETSHRSRSRSDSRRSKSVSRSETQSLSRHSKRKKS